MVKRPSLRVIVVPYVQVSFLFAIAVVLIWAFGSLAENPYPESTPIMLIIAIPIGLVVGIPAGLGIGALVGLMRLLAERARPVVASSILGLFGASLYLVAFELWFTITPTYRSVLQETTSVAAYGILMFVTRLYESRLR